MASNSLDVCAALLLHGAEARTFSRTAVPGSPVQQLLELFGGRAPGPGELPKLVNAVDPLLRPQVAQNLMSLAQAAAPPAAPVPPAATLPKPSPAQRAPAPAACGSLGNGSAQHRAGGGYAGGVRSVSGPGPSGMPVKNGAASRPGYTADAERKSSANAIGLGSQKQFAGEIHAAKREAPVTGKQTGGLRAHASLLGRAAAADDLEEVTNLLKARAEPNEYDKKGETPLFTAASLGSPDIVATLLLCNAEPLTKSIHGVTPWDVAACGETRSLLSFFAGQELEELERSKLLDCLSDSLHTAIGHAMSERAANRRGLRPAEELPEEAAAVNRQRPLPPLPPEVKRARDAMAAKESLQ